MTKKRQEIAVERKVLAERWAEKSCTLDGQPARILGRLCDFAKVASQKTAVEFSWHAVDWAMTNNKGRFNSV